MFATRLAPFPYSHYIKHQGVIKQDFCAHQQQLSLGTEVDHPSKCAIQLIIEAWPPAAPAPLYARPTGTQCRPGNTKWSSRMCCCIREVNCKQGQAGSQLQLQSQSYANKFGWWTPRKVKTAHKFSSLGTSSYTLQHIQIPAHP